MFCLALAAQAALSRLRTLLALLALLLLGLLAPVLLRVGVHGVAATERAC